MPLKQNASKSFQGSIVLGKGFVLTTEQATALITKDPRNKEVLFPYLNGEDLNNDPEQKASRWIINFFDWPEDKARSYPDCFEIVDQLVRPERQRWKLDENGGEIQGTYALRKPLPQKWWIYAEKRPGLYETISKLDHVMTVNRYTKYMVLDFQPKNTVFSDSIVILALDSYFHFAILSSSLHDIWAWKNSSTMGASTLRYSPSNAFESFPFPNELSDNIETIGNELYNFRKELMANAKIGITQTHNFYNDKGLPETHSLYTSISKLRNLYCDLDRAVVKIYNWNDLKLKHDFYEIDYLPENDRVRFTITPDIRKEILNRLLILNRERYNEEINQSPIKKQKRTIESSDSIDLFSNQ
jgi:hypothetical protein